MVKTLKNNSIHDLAYPLYEMLDLPQSTAFEVETVSSGTTALTLRVTVLNDPSRRFFVKTLRTGTGAGPHLRLGLREVQFYALIETLSPGTVPNIPKSIQRFISEDEGSYFLVLEDLSGTHQGHEHVEFSRLESWKIPLAALAEFHKRFTRRLTAEQVQTHADATGDVEGYIKKLENAFQQFKTDHHGLVAEPVFDLMARSIPLIRAFELDKTHRVHTNQLTTILHRDAHVKNFLYPRSADDPALIVDWQFWGLVIGTFDLRHLLGSALPGDLRTCQVDLVRFYYDRYMDGLDVDYAWSDCWMDYRKGIIDNLFMPVWQYTGFGWDIGRWGKMLETAVENYNALECDQIVL